MKYRYLKPIENSTIDQFIKANFKPVTDENQESTLVSLTLKLASLYTLSTGKHIPSNGILKKEGITVVGCQDVFPYTWHIFEAAEPNDDTQDLLNRDSEHYFVGYISSLTAKTLIECNNNEKPQPSDKMDLSNIELSR